MTTWLDATVCARELKIRLDVYLQQVRQELRIIHEADQFTRIDPRDFWMSSKND
jgi:hypothetical protein